MKEKTTVAQAMAASTADLLKLVIGRMEALQSGKEACREYAEVLMKSKKALQWLEKKE